MGKLNKRSFRPLKDRLQRPVTWPPACGFQLSTFLWDILTEYFKLRPLNWKPTFRDIFCNRNEPKQSINTAWQITEVSNSAKQKVNILKTEWYMYGCHEPYLQIFTHNLALSGSSRLLSRYALPLLRLWLCSDNCSTWSFIMASRARQATIESSSLLFITELNTALLVERCLTAAISYISSASVMLKCW